MTRAIRAHFVCALALTGVVACRPDFTARPSTVGGHRMLAIIGSPPEVAPGEAASFRAVVASTGGTVMNPGVQWAFCTAPKSLVEPDVVSAVCLDDSAIVPFQDNSGTVPSDACARFGPDVATTSAGQPPLRPRDADGTGGYYQPVRAAVSDLAPSFALERISCGFQGATPDLAAAFRIQYHANTNPVLLSLTATSMGQAVDFAHLAPGKAVDLVAAWTADSIEAFPVLDLPTQQIVSHTEAMSVSWYATSGTFDTDRTERAEGDNTPSSDNRWTPPTNARDVHFWVVLRDSRGGVDVLVVDGTIRVP